MAHPPACDWEGCQPDSETLISQDAGTAHAESAVSALPYGVFAAI